MQAIVDRISDMSRAAPAGDDRHRTDDEIYLLMKLRNHAEILVMYGAEVVAQAFRKMHQKMRHWGARTEAVHEHSVLVRWQSKALIRLCSYHGFEPRNGDIADGLEMLQAQWSVDALDVREQHILSLVVIREIASSCDGEMHRSHSDPESESEPGSNSSLPAHAVVPGRSRQWLESHRSDMTLAWQWHKALGQGRVNLALQPVRNSSTGHDLYHEALLRVRDDEAGCAAPSLSAGKAILALERLGLVRPLDRLVMSTVLDRLEMDPDSRLGCNVSALSLRLDGWWSASLHRLEARPDVAARLMLEVTETMPVPDHGEALVFLKKLKSLGCGIALDDVGSGYSSLGLAQRLVFDVIKVDAALLHAEREATPASSRLEKLVGYCRTLAPHVVLEGVEQTRDLALAQRIGVEWLQGYAIAMPAAPDLPMPVTGAIRC